MLDAVHPGVEHDQAEADPGRHTCQQGTSGHLPHHVRPGKEPRTRHHCSDGFAAAYADLWCALPDVVFSGTLDRVEGNARLAQTSLAEEVAAAIEATDKEVAIGGAGLATEAIEIGLVDELHMFRNPVVVGGGTPFLPPVRHAIQLDLLETGTFASRVIQERTSSCGTGTFCVGPRCGIEQLNFCQYE
ncbi:MAG: dihydrofolate reductase family protein [Actinomycetes bacterium]